MFCFGGFGVGSVWVVLVLCFVLVVLCFVLVVVAVLCFVLGLFWCFVFFFPQKLYSRRESNPRPSACEADVLTN